MSNFAKTVFASSCAFTAAVVGFVHLSQYLDRSSLHEGIAKEVAQQEKKTENLYNLQAQLDITKRYKESLELRGGGDVKE